MQSNCRMEAICHVTKSCGKNRAGITIWLHQGRRRLEDSNVNDKGSLHALCFPNLDRNEQSRLTQHHGFHGSHRGEKLGVIKHQVREGSRSHA